MPEKSESVDGIVLLDKSAGPTSRKVVEDVKRLLGAKIAGHVGTLDPNATGVLPILLGRATRVAPALERLDKEYVATIHFHKDVGDSEVNGALKMFIGAIKQKPPVKSAVVRKERVRNIYSIEVLDRDGRDIRLRVSCEAGTYIRKLASDLGLKLGGAHLKELRRTKAGPFDESLAHALDDIGPEYVLPVERAVEHLPKVVVSDSIIPSILNGSPIKTGILETSGKTEKGRLVAIMSRADKLVALGRYGAVIRIDRVLLTK